VTEIESQQRAPRPVPRLPEHLYSLDVARGFAALSVVLWHWIHFANPARGESPWFARGDQPLFDFLFPFYEQGAPAVDSSSACRDSSSSGSTRDPSPTAR
jgi:hypothetical protein